MRNVSDKICRENKKTHFVFNVFFFSFESRAVDEIMWKDIVQPDRPQTTTWRMRIACWITKATLTHSEYVILVAFLPHQWLHERASMLRYTYIACLVGHYFLRIVDKRRLEKFTCSYLKLHHNCNKLQLNK
jgi:hypothetical protein